MKTHTAVVPTVVALLSLAIFTASGHPSAGIVVDQQGNVFFSDLSRGLLRVDPQGKVTTVSKEGGHWLALDTAGSFSKVEFQKSAHWPRWFKRRTADGERPALVTDGGSPLVVTDGSLYYVCNANWPISPTPDTDWTPAWWQSASLARLGMPIMAVFATVASAVAGSNATIYGIVLCTEMGLAALASGLLVLYAVRWMSARSATLQGRVQ
jgi:hypothetical protein